MALIQPADRPEYWAVEIQGAIAYTGLTELDQATGTADSLTTYHDADENAYLGKAASHAANYNPLPDSGWLAAGDIYGYGGGLVIVRQSHNRTEHAPADVPALFSVYRPAASGPQAWVANEPVSVGMQRTYGGKTYRAVQSHVTQSDWQPPNVPALWEEVVETSPTGEWAVGVAYQIDDEVTYQGITYRCRQAHTSQIGWQPPAVLALWLPL